MRHFTFVILLAVLSSVALYGGNGGRDSLFLDGLWNSSLGPCMLPGTTDLSRLGHRNPDNTLTSGLTRLYPYEGKVTYTRIVDIPEDFAADLPEDAAFCLDLDLFSGDYANTWKLYVYPDDIEDKISVHVATKADSTLSAMLESGCRVVLFPDHKDIEARSVGGLFITDFWNWSMFKTISENAGKSVSPGTLGVINDPSHPLFGLFPNEGRSSWQWWSICRASRPLIVDELQGYDPVVEVIDNIERCHRLAMVSEFAVGKGSLLVCTADPEALSRTPEGRAFLASLMHYAASEDFSPAYSLSWDALLDILYGSAETRDIRGVDNQTDYKEFSENNPD